jgi:integrase
LLLRKPSTENRARQILFEALPHLEVAGHRAGVIAYLTACRGRGNDNRTLSNKLIRCSAFYKWCGVKLEIPKPKYTLRKPEVYTQAELTALFAAAEGRNFWLYKTLLQAGLRMQEAMNLTYDNLLDGGIQVCPHADWTPKDHEERIVRVPRALIDALRTLSPVGDSNLVFPSERGGINWHMLRSLVRCAKRAGVAHAYP